MKSSQSFSNGHTANLARCQSPRRKSLVCVPNACRGLVMYSPAAGRVLLNRNSLIKEQAMFRKPHSPTRQLILLTALALSASGIARADDSSMNPFIGDSYRYFNGGYNLGDPGQRNRLVLRAAPADPAWRQS